jgi:hypothetical protein
VFSEAEVEKWNKEKKAAADKAGVKEVKEVKEVK